MEEYIEISERECEYPVRAMLNMIRSELDRLYWNKNQKEMISPFDNTGAQEFKTDVFVIRSYNWSDGNIEPNFETSNIKIWWYKHSNRGIYVKIKNGTHFEDIVCETINDSIKSLHRVFKERE